MKSKQYSIYFSEETYEQIKRLADEQQRSINNMLVVLVRKGLEVVQDAKEPA